MLALELSPPPPATAFAAGEAFPLRGPDSVVGVGEVFGAGWVQPTAARAASETGNTMAFIMYIGFAVRGLK